MQENQATDGIFNAFDCEYMLGRPCSFCFVLFFTQNKKAKLLKAKRKTKKIIK